MKIRAALTAIALVLFVSGCGYRIVMTGMDAAFKLYPATIENRSNRVEGTSVFNDAVKLFLATNNAMADREEADYIGRFSLLELDYNASGTSTISARIKMEIEITDKEGKQVYTKVLSSFANSSSETSSNQNDENKAEAIRSAVEKAMQVFRNEFDK
ncbi:MAG: hypothetical protein AB7E76_12085 [Deferribacterales bacterium]